jgi:hypothetical protein
MREIRTEIQITAPPEKVWSLLTDFNNWKNWNPTINEISGDASVGSKLIITMRCEDGSKGHKYSPVITTFKKPNFMRWEAKMISNFLFSSDKIFELKETSSGTLLIHKEIFDGIIVTLFWGKMSPGILPMLKVMNEALKKKAEEAF